MNFLRRLSSLFYVTVVLFLAVFILLFVGHAFDIQWIYIFANAFYYDQNLRLAWIGIAVFLLFMNFLYYQFCSVNVHREKIIAFENPLGLVRVSLVALEDLVKKLLIKQEGVKEIRPIISAVKKGLNVKIKISLDTETHIPEFTSMLQDLVTRKIQDIIGLTDPVQVEIYITKIFGEGTDKDAKDTIKKETAEYRQPSTPYHGYLF